MQSDFVLDLLVRESTFLFTFHEDGGLRMSTVRTNTTESLPDVVNLFQTILANLPPGSARLETEHREDGEVRVKLIPSNPLAAKMVARGGGKMGYDLSVGSGTLFEIIPSRKMTTNRSAVEEFRAICEAVIDGNFEETVYTVEGKTVKTVGKLTIDNKSTKTRQWYSFYPLVPKKKRVIKYAPYFEGQTA